MTEISRSGAAPRRDTPPSAGAGRDAPPSAAVRRGAPPPAPASPRAAKVGGRRAETRLKLFTAAVEVIAEQGYTAATVEAIAERAGVAKGTVFYNFGSKEALFAAMLDHGIEHLAGVLAEAASGGPGPAVPDRDAGRTGRDGAGGPAAPGGETALDALDAVVMAQLRFFEEYGAFARVLLAEMWRTTWQDAVARLRDQVLGVYAGVLRRAVAEGLVREGLDVETAATAVFGMVVTVSIERRALHPDRPLEDLHATLADLLHRRVTG
ncbi:TetR/AcrR family transcriptional regulator [Streptosporangium sandarakinum]